MSLPRKATPKRRTRIRIKGRRRRREKKKEDDEDDNNSRNG